MVAVGGWVVSSGGSALSNVEAIAIQRNDVNCQPTDLPYAVSSHSTASTDLGLITCGGIVQGSIQSKCILQKRNGISETISEMKWPRAFFGMIKASNILYAIGGVGLNAEAVGELSSGRTMDTINIANIQTVAEWTEQELPFKVISHCVATLGDNKIVITGGEDSEPYENPNVSKNV